MGRDRQPIELVVSKGKSHLGKAEIESKRAREIKPCTDEIVAPKYLTKKQKEKFDKLASQLEKLKIIGETDVDALARYVLSEELYVRLTKQLTKKEILDDPELLEKYLKNQAKAFSQVDASARSLGLTISSRCKLILPEASKEEKQNKFGKFVKSG